MHWGSRELKAHMGAMILAVSSLCLAGCASSGTGRAVTADLTGPATTVAAAPGDTITLRLVENPTTGYAWQREGALPDGVVELNNEYVPDPVEPDPSGDIMTGAGGTRVLTYRCDRATSGELDFNLYPPGAGQSPVEERRAALTCK